MKYTRIHWANTPDMERKRKIDCIENYNMLILDGIHLSEIRKHSFESCLLDTVAKDVKSLING